MAREIAVPAETLRRLAGDAARAADRQEQKGRRSLANDLRKTSEKAYDAAAGQSSNFVAFPERYASTLCAFSDVNNSHHDGLRSLLKHYGVWE